MTKRARNQVAVANTWLTKRQHLAISLYAAGNKRSAVAKMMGVSPKTLEGHLERAKQKLNAVSLHQAVAIVAVSDALAA